MKTPLTIIWTLRLKAACHGVVLTAEPHPYGHADLDADVRSRAAEFGRQQPINAPMDAHQIEYFTCLYQRLDDGREQRASHAELRAAWDAAWTTAKLAADAAQAAEEGGAA